jgi:hypothetical protein
MGYGSNECNVQSPTVGPSAATMTGVSLKGTSSGTGNVSPRCSGASCICHEKQRLDKPNQDITFQVQGLKAGGFKRLGQLDSKC